MYITEDNFKLLIYSESNSLRVCIEGQCFFSVSSDDTLKKFISSIYFNNKFFAWGPRFYTNIDLSQTINEILTSEKLKLFTGEYINITVDYIYIAD